VADITAKQAHSQYSSLREKIVEHRFLSDVLKALWREGLYTTEVSRSESDAFGYDVVIECRSLIRHIQLKSRLNKKPVRLSVSRSLADKPNGCVICVMLDDDMEITSFLFYGEPPGQRRALDITGFKPSKRIRRDGDGNRPPRSNHVDVPMGKFKKIGTAEELVLQLFGPAKKLTASASH
jgi:hypothetical protein